MISQHWLSWGLVAFLLLYVAFYMTSMFKKVIAVGRNRGQERVLGPPSLVPRLDEAKLEELTRQMTELGFVQLGEHLSYFRDLRVTQSFVVSTPIAAPISEPGAAPQHQIPASFDRIFVHLQHGCLGHISILTIEDVRGEVAAKTWSFIGISSFTGTSESDWGYSTSSHRLPANLQASLKLLRTPRGLYIWIPGAAPDQLLKVHLARRVEIAQAAGITWKSQPTLEDAHELEDRAMEEMRAFYSRITPLQLARQFYPLLLDKKKEWLGELEGCLQAAR
jgi:hypothetical protein